MYFWLVLIDLFTFISTEKYIITSSRPLLNIQYDFPVSYETTSVIGDSYFHFIEAEEPPFYFFNYPDVIHVELDHNVSTKALYDLQRNPEWNLDRVDQRSVKLNKKYYSQKSGGKGVDNYVLDTGIDISHPEFQGRAIWGANYADNEGPTGCMDAHGTHVAGTIASKTYGVAKKTTVISVKVLDCFGSGSTSGVIKGIEYVYSSSRGNRKVINMSLGGPKNLALNKAIEESVKAGIVVVSAAGNENADACDTSPASENTAITVGASNIQDQITYFSNWGKCVTIFAPGSRIKSTIPGNGTDVFDGTSQATPLVAGVISLILSSSPRTKPLSPLEIKDFLSKTSTKDVLSGNLRGSPNELVFSLSYPV